MSHKCRRNCGKEVSDNADYCAACKDRVPTHFVHTFPRQKAEMLFDADTGMCVGQAQNNVVIFGREPNKRSSHVFAEDHQARAYLRTHVAENDAKLKGIELKLVCVESVDGKNDGEALIVMPKDSMEIPIPNYTRPTPSKGGGRVS